MNKPRHGTQTRQEPPERCKNKTKTEQINKQIKADLRYMTVDSLPAMYLKISVKADVLQHC